MCKTSAVIVSFSLIFVALVSSTPLNSAKVIQKRSAEDEGPKKIVAAGNTVELMCTAFGNSPPLIHWLKDEVFIPQGPLDNIARNMMAPVNPAGTESEEESYQYNSVSKLVLRDTAPEDSGNYSCVADLPEERKTKHFGVEVTPQEGYYQPSKRSNTHNEETRIYLYTDQAFGVQGVASIYICRATQGMNKAPPLIQWSINGEEITDDTPGFKIHSNGDLIVTETTSAFHMAEITCTATGENGSDEISPFVYVFEPDN